MLNYFIYNIARLKKKRKELEIEKNHILYLKCTAFASLAENVRKFCKQKKMDDPVRVLLRFFFFCSANAAAAAAAAEGGEGQREEGLDRLRQDERLAVRALVHDELERRRRQNRRSQSQSQGRNSSQVGRGWLKIFRKSGKFCAKKSKLMT